MEASDPSGLSVAAVKPRLRVLIVEDSELDARVLVSLLRQGGWTVENLRVETAEAMTLALEDSKWDLVLSDHSLPEFSAPKALEILQASGLDIPFLIVSGGIEEGVAIEAMKAGANDFLWKGSLARLVPAVQRELREAAAREAGRRAERAMRDSELRYRSVWENSLDAVLLLDMTGVIRFANPAVLSVFGRASDELIGKGLDAFRRSDGAVNDWWQRVRSGRQGTVVETILRGKGGTTPPEVDIEVAFTEMRMADQLWVVVFARDITERRRAEEEIQRSREEFAAARKIQQQLLPSASPDFHGVAIAGLSEMAVAAGGDCFDYLKLADGSLGLLVADVSGHGLAAALLMAEARAYFRLLARQSSDPSEILTAVNSALAEDLDPDRFITVGLYCIDPECRKLRYASAGHPPAHVLGADGKVRHVLEWTGPPLKRRTRQPCRNGPEVDLKVGDVLLLVTDGIEEAMTPDEKDVFGALRMVDVVQRNLGEKLDEVARRLLMAVREFCAPKSVEDDLTVVLARIEERE